MTIFPSKATDPTHIHKRAIQPASQSATTTHTRSCLHACIHLRTRPALSNVSQHLYSWRSSKQKSTEIYRLGSTHTRSKDKRKKKKKKRQDKTREQCPQFQAANVCIHLYHISLSPNTRKRSSNTLRFSFFAHFKNVLSIQTNPRQNRPCRPQVQFISAAMGVQNETLDYQKSNAAS